MFQTIVFAYDGSAECRDALEEGIALASRFNASCHLLAVVPPLSPYFLAAGPLSEDLSEKDRAYISIVDPRVKTKNITSLRWSPFPQLNSAAPFLLSSQLPLICRNNLQS